MVDFNRIFEISKNNQKTLFKKIEIEETILPILKSQNEDESIEIIKIKKLVKSLKFIIYLSMRMKI